ncbi:MAG: hypothetical protein ACXU9J_08520, partial [Syntrophales bacterium]
MISVDLVMLHIFRNCIPDDNRPYDKKVKGKSQPCVVYLVCHNKNIPKGGLPWIKVTNLISLVNTFT